MFNFFAWIPKNAKWSFPVHFTVYQSMIHNMFPPDTFFFFVLAFLEIYSVAIKQILEDTNK